MKLGIFSDLHLEFADYEFPTEMLGDADIWLNAGDTVPHLGFRMEYEKIFHDVEYMSILGNHDVYRDWFNLTKNVQIKEVNGVRFIGCTLWTDPGDPATQFIPFIKNYLVDSHWINGYSYELYKEIHEHHVDVIRKSKPDVVMTHHLPSFMSVHPRYAKDPNVAFASNLEELIREIKPKVWIHGHTHESFDYEIGDTRVICHPRGYPGETNFGDYKPLIMEI